MKRKDSDGPGGSDEDPADYEVGYRKPPTATRFQPGQSGNPRGRPRGSRGRKTSTAQHDRLKQIIVQEAYRVMPVREGNQMVDMSVMQAIVRSAVVSALKGQPRSQQLLLNLVEAVETEKREERHKAFEVAVEYKDRWDPIFAYHRKNGLPDPNVLPHPDDVIIDPWTGSVMLVGPLTQEEKRQRDLLGAIKADVEAEINYTEKRRRRSPADPKLVTELARYRSVIDRINRVLSFERILAAPKE